jgi:hypothetical protein
MTPLIKFIADMNYNDIPIISIEYIRDETDKWEEGAQEIVCFENADVDEMKRRIKTTVLFWKFALSDAPETSMLGCVISDLDWEEIEMAKVFKEFNIPVVFYHHEEEEE